MPVMRVNLSGNIFSHPGKIIITKTVDTRYRRGYIHVIRIVRTKEMERAMKIEIKSWITGDTPMRLFLDTLGLLMIVGLCWIGWVVS